MSLSRLALRLAVIETLAPSAQLASAAPQWPTLALGNVHDSRIGVQPATEEQARCPAIGVFTDDVKIETTGTAQDVSIPGSSTHMVTLAFEITVPQNVLIDDMPQTVIAAETDGVAEAMLDLIEHQIVAALNGGRLSVLSKPLLTISKIESRPWHDADSDVRLSARRMEMECRIPEYDGTLALVAEKLPPGSYGAGICTSILAALREPAALPALNEIRFAASLARAAGDAAGAAVNAETTPPQGDLGGTVTLKP